MNPHRLILELVESPLDSDCRKPEEWWFLRLRRDSSPDDPWEYAIPLGWGMKGAPVEEMGLVRIATRYLLHNQPKPVRHTPLDAIPETDWNEVFGIPETRSPEISEWGPETGSRVHPWRYCGRCWVQWTVADSGEPCPDCGQWGTPMPTRSDNVPIVAYSWSTQQPRRGAGRLRDPGESRSSDVP